MFLPRLAVVFAIALSPVAAQADALLDQLRREAKDAPVVAFERTVRTDMLSGKGPASSVQVDRFNASTRQWTLVSIDGRPPTVDETAKHAKQVAALPVPGFHRLSTVMAGAAKRSTDGNGRTVYRWEQLPAGALASLGPDISTKLSAEALVEDVGGRPMVSQMRVYATQPFSIMSVAKMNVFNLVTQYRLKGGSAPFLAIQTSETDLSAPFGRGIKQKTQANFRPL